MEEEMMGSIEKLRSPGPMPTWKLYDNPHYSSPRHDHHHHHSSTTPPLPSCHLPYSCLLPSASRLKSSLATLLRPMDCDAAPSELDVARAQIRELRAELDLEKRMRRKAESLNRTLARELADARAAREAAEALCARLTEELARGREEAERAAREVEEERRMLRVAEVWREERVQMKLAEARLLFEEKLKQMSSKPKEDKKDHSSLKSTPDASSPTVTENQSSSSGSTGQQSQQQKREVENPHIKRGIKGFVEFPRVIRIRANFAANASREAKGRMDTANLVECQKAQLRILRHRNPAVGLGLTGTPGNLVM